MNPLTDSTVRAEIARAWRESEVDDPINRHEEGGYIVLNHDRTLGVARWPRGEKSRIVPPPLDADRLYNGMAVVAAFHTHPNPPIDERGRQWEQAPGESDRRWHRRHRLRGFVIGRSFVYEIDEDARVSVLGKRNEVP